MNGTGPLRPGSRTRFYPPLPHQKAARRPAQLRPMRRRAHEQDRCHGRLIASLLCVLACRFGLVALPAYRLQIAVIIHLVPRPPQARCLRFADDVIHLSGQRDLAGLVARPAQSAVASHHPVPEFAPVGAVPALRAGAPVVVFRPTARVTLVGIAVAMRGARQR